MGLLLIGKALGGGQQTPQAPNVQDTEAGKAQLEIARHALDRYRTSGVKVTEEYISRQQGRFDGEGMARLDTSSARTVNEASATLDPGRVNPNTIGRVASFGRENARAGAGAEIEMGIKQQRRAQQGVLNAAGLGSGRTPEALATHGDLAAQAQAENARSAQRSLDRRQQNRYLVGNLLGTAAGIPLSKIGQGGDEIEEAPTAQQQSGPF